MEGSGAARRRRLRFFRVVHAGPANPSLADEASGSWNSVIEFWTALSVARSLVCA